MTVWCGVGTFGIVGPVFPENNNGECITVTAEHYVTMLQNVLLTQLEALGAEPNDLYFQQDGATAHTTRCTMDVVRNLFQKVISRFGDILWPAYSPDITVPDFFL